MRLWEPVCVTKGEGAGQEADKVVHLRLAAPTDQLSNVGQACDRGIRAWCQRARGIRAWRQYGRRRPVVGA